MLKRLEVVGFKSFAKKTVLDFLSSTTAIVGPNGSGKSNVAEAFRFALGEQSMKSMRGKRAEDLIFNGSHSAPRANRAAVAIVFDNRPKGAHRPVKIDLIRVHAVELYLWILLGGGEDERPISATDVEHLALADEIEGAL